MSRPAGVESATRFELDAVRFTFHRYFVQSTLPLTILLFVLPMLILYEVGTRFYASDALRQTETRVLAFVMIRQFMELFGATGRYLPALSVVGILLAWHLARRDPWRIQLGTAAGMSIESALLAFPLLALGSFISHLVGHYLPLAASPPGNWQPVTGNFLLALGYGVYEELLFRLMAFALLSILLTDLLRLHKRFAYPLIVVGSALLFSAYHYWTPLTDPFRLSDFLFRTIAGIYFGILFLTRGFGITSGAHAAYDIYYFAIRAFSGL